MNIKANVPRSLAASLLLGLVVVASVFGIVADMANLATATEERDAKSAYVGKDLRAGTRPSSGKGGEAQPGLFFAGESQTLAAARVDELVRAKVVEAGGAVLSSRTEARHDDSGLPDTIVDQAVIVGSNDALQAVLFNLENGKPLVLVDSLSVQPVEATGGDPQTASLRATVTLIAYWTAAPH